MTTAGRMELTLEDGTRFAGRSFGADVEWGGEVVFNTGMTGYVEALTDPSYRGQILVLTYPSQGNYGVPDRVPGLASPHESDRIQVRGLVVLHEARRPSHHSSAKSLGDWLRESGVPAIDGVDTRRLTTGLRERGTMTGWLARPGRGDAELRALPTVDWSRVAADACGTEVTRHSGDGPRVLVVDTGVKRGIVRALVERGASVIVAPYQVPLAPLVAEVDGVLLGNGPGDPTALLPLVDRLRSEVLASRKVVFGVCMGHQLLALACGGRTSKLRYGHRSQNQPVRQVATGRHYITSQNHGYVVSALPPGFEPWFENANDGSNEGIRHPSEPWSSVQFHPEARPGPEDTGFLFDEFLRNCARGRP